MVYWRIYAITKRHSQQRLKDTQRMDETLYQMTTTLNGKNFEFKETKINNEKQQKYIKNFSNNLENLNNLSMESDVNSICCAKGKEEENVVSLRDLIFK